MSLKQQLAEKLEAARRLNKPTLLPLRKGAIVKVHPNKVLEVYRHYNVPSDTEIKTFAAHAGFENFSVIKEEGKVYPHTFIVPDEVKDFEIPRTGHA
jgi:hypothetical protein